MNLTLFIELGTLLVALFLLYFLIRFLKNPLHIIANSIGGILIFFILNFVFNLQIPINIISVAVVGLGGMFGVFLVLLLHFLGLAF